MAAFLLFLLTAKAFPEAMPNRIDTWMSRIENFASPEEGSSGNYQVERAKIAIATGGLTGLGVGKSVMKNFYLKAVQTLFMRLSWKNLV